MEENYSKDFLAKYRTHLANERTFLAYLRSSLASLGLGFVLLKFVSSTYMTILAIIIILSGPVLFIYGWKRFLFYKVKIGGGQEGDKIQEVF